MVRTITSISALCMTSVMVILMIQTQLYTRTFQALDWAELVVTKPPQTGDFDSVYYGDDDDDDKINNVGDRIYTEEIKEVSDAATDVVGSDAEPKKVMEEIVEKDKPFLEWRNHGLNGVDLSPAGRSKRFPSIEERIMFYMTSWYRPACPDELVEVQELNATTLYVQGPGDPTVDTTNNMTIYTQPVCHTIFAVEDTALQNCLKIPKGNIKQTYCPELIEHIFPVYQSSAPNHEQQPPLLIQVGDMMMTSQPKFTGRPAWLYTTIPHLGKTRYAWDDKDWENIRSSLRKRGCDDSSNPRPMLNGHLEPIIWKLNRIRHYPDILENLLDDDTQWDKKIDGAIFRGIPTGEADRRLPPRERCAENPRCRLALAASNSTIVNAKLVALSSHKIGRFDDLLDEVPSIQDKAVPIPGQLRYKGVIMIEGNDVSTGLKWALRSNSVVLMPKPTVSSWLMEEWLEPYVHYIPLRDDFSDVESQTQWMLDNDAEAQRIARRGQLWMEDLLFHSQAKTDEANINLEVFSRYRKLFRQVK